MEMAVRFPKRSGKGRACSKESNIREKKKGQEHKERNGQ
jgi:hypothetical protein